MYSFSLPYGKSYQEIQFNFEGIVDHFLPSKLTPKWKDNVQIESAIRSANLSSVCSSNSRVVITINDKTRPVPNNLLFPPLLKELQDNGVLKENITIVIATGTHTPMPVAEHNLLLNSSVLSQYNVVSHDCDDIDNLTFMGQTSRGTPVYVNSIFTNSDLIIVVGNIEPHHFAGFSGGVKSAAIGVCGRETINHNHSLLQDPRSCVGRYDDNPLRQDIEEIGEIIGVDLALNVILNEKKEILHVFFGKPKEVMTQGIKIIRDTQMTLIEEPYDLVIASAGGYPKDINLYQAQKGLTHASMFCRDGGTVILAVECQEGVGSQSYLASMEGILSHNEAKKKFLENGFVVGPHKAFQFATIAERVNFLIKSEIEHDIMKKLLIQPVSDLNRALQEILSKDDTIRRVAVVPYAMATIPVCRE